MRSRYLPILLLLTVQFLRGSCLADRILSPVYTQTEASSDIPEIEIRYTRVKRQYHRKKGERHNPHQSDHHRHHYGLLRIPHRDQLVYNTSSLHNLQPKNPTATPTVSLQSSACVNEDGCPEGEVCVPVLGSKHMCAKSDVCFGTIKGNCPQNTKGEQYECVWTACQAVGTLKDHCTNGVDDNAGVFGKFMCTRRTISEYAEKEGKDSKCLQTHENITEAENILNSNLAKIQALNDATGQEADIFGPNKYTGTLTHPSNLFRSNLLLACTSKDFNGHFGLSISPTDLGSLDNQSLVLMESIAEDASFDSIPKYIDWRDQKAVTRIRNQQSCNSCWAHVAAQQVESASIIAGWKADLYSVQQVFDCVDTSDYGRSQRPVCGTGGFYLWGFTYASRQKGLNEEPTYPLTSKSVSDAPQSCKVKSSPAGGDLLRWGFAASSASDASCGCNCVESVEKRMAIAVATIGPLAAAVKADDLKYYKSGVVQNKPLPCGQNVNHAVQIIGYDMTGAVPYWIVKNTWGDNWGESGCFKLEMFKNTLGIANLAMFTVAKPAPCNPKCAVGKYCDTAQNKCVDQSTELLALSGGTYNSQSAGNARVVQGSAGGRHATFFVSTSAQAMVSFIVTTVMALPYFV